MIDMTNNIQRVLASKRERKIEKKERKKRENPMVRMVRKYKKAIQRIPNNHNT